MTVVGLVRRWVQQTRPAHPVTRAALQRGSEPPEPPEPPEPDGVEARSAGESTWWTWGEAAALVVRGATVSVAAPAAAVVGTVLSAVNEGDVLVSGDAGGGTVIKIGVNYVVPFIVASVGFLGARRAPRGSGAPGRGGSTT